MSTWTGAVSTDWNDAANWTTGGTGTGVPSATVDAIFSGTPTRPCILGANRTCRALTFTGYTSTVDLATFTLTANNNVTFQVNQSSLILGSTGILISNATSTITSNGGTWPLSYRINNIVGTITLADDMRISGSFNTVGGTQTLNGNILYIGTNLTGASTLLGTTNFVMNGTGTVSGAGYNLEINTTGAITVSGNLTLRRRFVITAHPGTITGLSTSNITFIGVTGTCTIDLGGRTVANFTMSADGSPTYQFLSDFYCTNFSMSNGTNAYNGPTSPSTAKIYISGNLSLGSVSTTNGTLSLEMTGNGSITGLPTLGLPLNINSGANTITFPATFNIGAITLTRTSGIVNAGTNTVNLFGTTLNTPGVSFYDVTINSSGGNSTITCNSLVTITNNLRFGATGNATFAGTAGWTCANLICSVAGRTLTLQNSITYTTTTNASLTASTGNNITMTSNSATIRAIWTLNNGASQTITYVNGTRIDSSLGQTIWSFGGVLTNTLNWNVGTRPGTVGYTFVN
jgi:hypothetical protein